MPQVLDHIFITLLPAVSAIIITQDETLCVTLVQIIAKATTFLSGDVKEPVFSYLIIIHLN